MKNTVIDRSTMIPPEMRWLTETLGWCGKAVDSLADRLVFNSFDNDNFDLLQVFSMNNPDVLFDNAVLSALISSCCYIYIFHRIGMAFRGYRLPTEAMQQKILTR
jgi:hypothetical protein